MTTPSASFDTDTFGATGLTPSLPSLPSAPSLPSLTVADDLLPSAFVTVTVFVPSLLSTISTVGVPPSWPSFGFATVSSLVTFPSASLTWTIRLPLPSFETSTVGRSQSHGWRVGAVVVVSSVCANAGTTAFADPRIATVDTRARVFAEIFLLIVFPIWSYGPMSFLLLHQCGDELCPQHFPIIGPVSPWEELGSFFL